MTPLSSSGRGNLTRYHGSYLFLSLMLLSTMSFSARAFFQLPHLSRSLVVQNAQLHSGSNLIRKFSSMSAESNKKNGKKEKVESIYKNTVILPETSFSLRANAIKREPQIQKFWEDEKIYQSQAEKEEAEKFILHDGPPYANGDLHIGHAMNKILKDFINRYNILKGKRVNFICGWDCHGLPIELKVLQTMKSKERQSLSPLDLRKKAAEFARDTVEKQKASFQRYGVWADWDNSYLTLLPEYEAAQIKVFGEMVMKGIIYRGRKPVNWSPSSRTALAEAELEYPENHISKSIYVGFKVTTPSEALAPFVNEEPIKVAIWTTTPWTIPANLAVAVNKDLTYSLVKHPVTNERYIVAKDLIKSLASKMGLEDGQELDIIESFSGSDLEGTKYQHPVCDRESAIVIGGDYITTESGTGLVHTAPGHGQEDYQTGLKYGLPLLSPVDDAGRFTSEAGERFEGKSVLGDGNTEVIDALTECGALIVQEDYNHKYPYDWRTKKPTIFRATDQWFASVDSFRDDAMNAINQVRWIPDFGKNRISAMTQSRSDWCISRQRNWGVPIPVFYNVETGEPLLTEESIQNIENIFREKGSDAWWELDTADLLPESHKAEADKWQKGTDTMDVWFDSGTSWAGVAGTRDYLGLPVDMYLEGSDQHRGWFQSSLLTSVAARGVAPYKTVLTHGFVLDEKGYKMSKSLGNVIDPYEIINGGKNLKQNPAYGADVLRLWVSTVDYSGDVCIGPGIVKQVFESYRKLRNTARYLIGSLSDFAPENEVAYDDLPKLDKWILGRMTEVMKEVNAAYEDFQFYRAAQAIQQFTVADLSNFYLDVAKDRLYISGAGEQRRRSCQTTIKIILDNFSKAIAPILPHMAEDIWLNLPYEKQTTSIFQAPWELPSFPQFEEAQWAKIRQVRNDVNKVMETARNQKVIGASLESQIYIHTEDSELKALLGQLKGDDLLLAEPTKGNAVDDLRFLLMVSGINFVESKEEVISACDDLTSQQETESGCFVGVAKASGIKCERCWYHDESVGTEEDHEGVCSRCASIVRDYEKVHGPLAEPATV